MDLERIVSQLKQEMARLERAIGWLEEQSDAPTKRRRGRPPGRPAGSTSKNIRRKGLTPAGRKRLSEMMKKRWAERRRQPS